MGGYRKELGWIPQDMGAIKKKGLVTGFSCEGSGQLASMETAVSIAIMDVYYIPVQHAVKLCLRGIRGTSQV